MRRPITLKIARLLAFRIRVDRDTWNAGKMKGYEMRYSLLLLFVVFRSGAVDQNSDWDYLIFSQKWPVSFCIHYENGQDNRKCLLPEDKREWTVHGVWPSRFSGDDVSYCNKTARFDEDKIAPIRGDLEKLWPNLEGDKNAESLWEHEWLKHGTCAQNFEPLDNERKYFETGLNLYRRYNMTSLLPTLNIFPDQTKELKVADVIDGIEKKLRGAPFVSCLREKKKHRSILFELRICFDKEFQVIDCGDREMKELGRFRPVTNCPAGATIIYPKSVDVELQSLPQPYYFNYL